MPRHFSPNSFLIDGINITPDKRPECLWTEDFDCYACGYFDLSSCRLRKDPDFRNDLKTLLDISKEYQERQIERQRQVMDAIKAELKAHGRPLHYTVLARMVQERNPNLEVTERGVLVFMGHHQDIFESQGDGIFRYRG